MFWFLAYVGTIFGANWSLQHYGIVSIGFGQMAPAGVLFAGLAFTFRDLLQDARGRNWTVSAIVVGTIFSWLVSPSFAAASALAFAASEFADFSVYTPLRKRHWLGAVALSNTVGLVVDSTLFLWLAFGSLAYIQGQLIGKAYMTALAIIVLWAVRDGAVRDLFVWMRSRRSPA